MLKRLMIDQCRRDIQLFATHFFAHHIRRPFGHMHREMFQDYRRHIHAGPIEQRQGHRSAVAAPRGAAKSTIRSLVFPIHASLYGMEKYIIILSATLKQAEQRLLNIRNEILTNRRLREIFEDRLDPDQRASRKNICIDATRIEVYSAGTEIRGISHGPWRPSLVLLDDIEDSRAAKSLARRDNLLQWYNEVIENIGDSYTHIQIVGTLLHPDSLLALLLRRPDYESRVFRSIERFAENETLWEKWRSRYTNLEDPDRLENARRFFNRNRGEMLAGTRVLWQARENYYDLMCQMVTKGRTAFFKEKQNEPAAAEEAFFDISRAVLFQPEKDVRLEDLAICGFLDAATGNASRKGKGDYAAIATVGRDRHGYLYLLDLWMRRASPTRQIAALFDLHARWNYTLFGIEGNCFQQLLLLPIEEERKRRRQSAQQRDLPPRTWQLPIQPVHHHQNKEMRIATLEPLATNGWLRFAEGLSPQFWTQLENFPQVEHDDGLDALEGAVSLVQGLETQSRRGPRRKSSRRLGAF